MPESCTGTSSFECDRETCVGEFEMHAPGARVFEFVANAEGNSVDDCRVFALTDGPQTRSAVEEAQGECFN